jgi:hypothetical protein
LEDIEENLDLYYQGEGHGYFSDPWKYEIKTLEEKRR